MPEVWSICHNADASSWTEVRALISLCPFRTFPLMSFSCLVQATTFHSVVPCVLRLPGSGDFSDLPCFGDLDRAEGDHSGTTYTVLCRDLSDALLMTRLGVWVWGGRPQRQSVIVIPSYPQYLVPNMTYHCRCWLWSPAEVFVRCHCIVTPPPTPRLSSFEGGD